MASGRTSQYDWALYERVARSLAHSVGNTINVVSGRLSLLERQTELGAELIGSLRKARARLLTLQEELRFALHMPPEDATGSDRPLAQLLPGIAGDAGVELGNAELLHASEAERVTGNEIGFRCLADACRLLGEGSAGSWLLGTESVRGREALTLTVPLESSRAPEDRKALLEPWFSQEVQRLDGKFRYGRLLLAQALGLLEDSGAALSIRQVSPGLTAVVLIWSQ